jgi:hypothetical protein
MGIFSAVTFYASDAFLKTSHNSRQVSKHVILPEFFGVCIISNFAHNGRLY